MISFPQALQAYLDALPERLFKVGGILLFAAAFLYRVSTRGSYTNPWLFGLELAIPGSILVGYLLRAPAARRARGWRGVVLPLVASVLPFGLLVSPPSPFGMEHQTQLLWLLCVPTALMLWAYLTLGSSFAILADVRTIKTHGPYRFIRHPAYTAQLMCGLLVMIWRFSCVTLAFYTLFLWVQVQRARAEEEILSHDPEYVAYMARTGRFLPS